MSLVGNILQGYRLVERIGFGGMGSVYLAEHVGNGHQVAVKVLHARYAAQDDPLKRFFNEARAVNMVKHRNIVDIYAQGTAEGVGPYLMMEHLVGEDLKVRLKREGRQSLPEVIAIVHEVSSALQAIHECGIIHRDLKPSNLYLLAEPGPAGEQRIKVLDFGVAKLLETTRQSDPRTEPGAVLGTPTYIAPEQCLGARSIDHRADVYSLGVIAYHALCGRPPFMAEMPTVLLAMQVRDTPPAPRLLNPALPVALDRVLLRALEKQPDDRFENMRAFRDAFVAAATGDEVPHWVRKAERETAIAAQPLVGPSPDAETRVRPGLARLPLETPGQRALANDNAAMSFLPIAEGTPMVSLPRVARRQPAFLHAVTKQAPPSIHSLAKASRNAGGPNPWGTAVKLERIDVDLATDTARAVTQRTEESVVTGVGLDVRITDSVLAVLPAAPPPASKLDAPPPGPIVAAFGGMSSVEVRLPGVVVLPARSPVDEDSASVLSSGVAVPREPEQAPRSIVEQISRLRDLAVGRGVTRHSFAGAAALLICVVGVSAAVLIGAPRAGSSAAVDAKSAAAPVSSGAPTSPAMPADALPEQVEVEEGAPELRPDDSRDADAFALEPLVVEHKPDAPRSTAPATARHRARSADPVAKGTPEERSRAAYIAGVRFVATNNTREALASLHEAVKLDPRYAAPHKVLGMVYIRRGDVSGMCTSFKHYLRLAPRAWDSAKLRLELEKYAGANRSCKL